MWLLIVHTLPAASKPRNGLQPFLVVGLCTGARDSANDHAQSEDDDDRPASVLEAILGNQVGQREDTACDEDGVDVSVGVDVDAVVGVCVHGQGVNLGVSLGVCLVGSPLPHLPRLSGSPSEIRESYDWVRSKRRGFSPCRRALPFAQ